MTGASDVLGRYQASYQDSVLLRSEGVSERQQLEEVAREFEALLIKQMLDSMRNTLNKDNNLVDGGMSENIFEDMLYTEYSRLMSKTGGFGLAEMIVEQQVRLQRLSEPPLQIQDSARVAYEYSGQL